MKSADYYEITDLGLIGKTEGNLPYIYDPEQGWILDREFLLMDRIMGYDASEPGDSPYKLGSFDMLERVRRISGEEAEKRILLYCRPTEFTVVSPGRYLAGGLQSGCTAN